MGLMTLAEYETTGGIGYFTFPAEIIHQLEVNFNLPTAAAMAVVLLAVGLLYVSAAGIIDPAGFRKPRTGLLGGRSVDAARLGRWTLPVFALPLLVVVVGVGVPVGTNVYWLVDGGVNPITSTAVGSTLRTVMYAGLGAGLASLLALPLAFLSVRTRRSAGWLIERCSYLVLALPGSVLALAYTRISFRDFGGLGSGSAELVVLTYAVLFLPFSLVGLSASLGHIPNTLEAAAQTLGASRSRVLTRVTLPLLSPGLLAGFALAFMAGVTELAATLILAPPGAGSQTLATQFWALHNSFDYPGAAPYALAMIAVSIPPALLLAVSFSRVKAAHAPRLP